jgi:hypothetical protein
MKSNPEAKKYYDELQELKKKKEEQTSKVFE